MSCLYSSCPHTLSLTSGKVLTVNISGKLGPSLAVVLQRNVYQQYKFFGREKVNPLSDNSFKAHV